ncbi:MAG: hypothetical protein ABFR75_10355 [Acidobacteriota bacterium]
MEKEKSKILNSLLILSYSNVIIWVISMIAMIFLMRDFPGVKKLYPILGGGVAVGILILSIASRIKKIFS